MEELNFLEATIMLLVKAMVLARGYLAEDGMAVVFMPEFVDVDIEGKVRTAIKIVVEIR